MLPITWGTATAAEERDRQVYQCQTHHRALLLLIGYMHNLTWFSGAFQG